MLRFFEPSWSTLNETQRPAQNSGKPLVMQPPCFTHCSARLFWSQVVVRQYALATGAAPTIAATTPADRKGLLIASLGALHHRVGLRHRSAHELVDRGRARTDDLAERGAGAQPRHAG